jgi:molybdopterin-guanine dinucleotide biosynthesis protein A
MPTDTPLRRRPSFGAILAGGASRRFGAPKALAEVGGRAIVERVRDALASAVGEVVLVANDAGLFGHLGLAMRPDDVAGAGALGGIRTALAWAREQGRPGALCIACDMPFVSPELLREMLERSGAGDVDAVVPESGGRRGCEPLCAWYSAGCLPSIDRMMGDGDTAVHLLLDRVRAARIPLEDVSRHGDPDVLFLNVNTADDHARAVRIASSSPDGRA